MKENDHDAIRFSFKVFERKTSSSTPTIDIAFYPVPIECRESLQKIAGDYVDISSKLPGALVECYFGITYRSFGGDDTFGGIIQQVIILRAAVLKPPSPIKPSASRPYRATILSPEQVHAQEQRAVLFFTTPVSSAGPSNSKPFLHYKLLQLLKLTSATVPITKRKASAEPEGSNPKRVNTSENTDGSNDKGKKGKKADENGN
ncbi:hypothetical protein DFH08DRAFT_812450 [Mycena albidolilacea]|uniref:Uncharacterized protein n=1 Tax=Mycena albidolilacea TaxID=1033008 RepID=A0AAD6ZTF9_9AGAR|nr:hypothetical protein DFH08DRAFT_812450 [Mycena albidolilacea]